MKEKCHVHQRRAKLDKKAVKTAHQRKIKARCILDVSLGKQDNVHMFAELMLIKISHL